MRDLLDEARALLDWEGDLKKQCVVLMGLPAAGKSTFIKNELSKHVPGFKGFSVSGSDVQVRHLQYQTALEHWGQLQKLDTPVAFSKFRQRISYKDNGGVVRMLPLTWDELKAFKGPRDYFDAMYKPYYATYFDIRDMARVLDNKLFDTKIKKTANMLVIDTTATDTAKVKERLRQAKDEGFQTSVFFLDIAPELCIIRDKYRGETEGRSVGEGAIFGYAKKMKETYAFYETEGARADGSVDRLYHFVWTPDGSSPIKGTWSMAAKKSFDVTRALAKRKEAL